MTWVYLCMLLVTEFVFYIYVQTPIKVHLFSIFFFFLQNLLGRQASVQFSVLSINKNNSNCFAKRVID